MRCDRRNADLEFFWNGHEEKNKAGAKDQHSMSVAVDVRQGGLVGGNVEFKVV
jgi:hypothetical protein